MAKGYQAISPEFMDYLDADEIDAVKAIFAYMLLDGTDLDGDTVYSLVFQGGRKIIWH